MGKKKGRHKRRHKAAKKNPAAVALGKLGGSKGGKARAANLSPERRSDIARAAARKRWAAEALTTVPRDPPPDKALFRQWRSARAEAMFSEWKAGASLEEVGQRWGLTRERIRQILKPYAPGGTLRSLKTLSRPSPEEVVAEARKPGMLLVSTAKALGINSESVLRRLRQSPHYAGVRRLWKVRRRFVPRSHAYSKEELIAHMQEVARIVGRTPGAGDLNANGPPLHTTYFRAFGSMVAAQKAAGLEPNLAYKDRTHCRRGHELAGGNIDWRKVKSATGVEYWTRSCYTCRQERAAARRKQNLFLL